jgi:hypothetical protein
VVPSRRPYRFVLKVTVVSTVAYLVAGLFAYRLLTKRFYVGDDAIFAGFLRSEADPILWRHVMTWQFPVLVARGLLISLALLPFRAALSSFTLRARVLSLFGLFFVLLHMAAAAPSPSNLEGIVYMRPEFTGIGPFLLTQPEMIFQSLLFALGTGLWACESAEPRSATLAHDDGTP